MATCTGWYDEISGPSVYLSKNHCSDVRTLEGTTPGAGGVTQHWSIWDVEYWQVRSLNYDGTWFEDSGEDWTQTGEMDVWVPDGLDDGGGDHGGGGDDDNDGGDDDDDGGGDNRSEDDAYIRSITGTAPETSSGGYTGPKGQRLDGPEEGWGGSSQLPPPEVSCYAEQLDCWDTNLNSGSQSDGRVTYRTGTVTVDVRYWGEGIREETVSIPIVLGNPLDDDLMHLVSSSFGPRWGGIHGGLDLADKGNEIVAGETPVYAAADGLVGFAGEGQGSSSDYGNVVYLLHEYVDPETNEVTVSLGTVYGHLDSVVVETGATVQRGDVIGYFGHTGHTVPEGPGGTHLHFEIRKDYEGGAGGGYPMDPQAIFTQLKQ